MRIIFAGAERESTRSTLRSAGVTDFAISLKELSVSKRKGLDFAAAFGEGADVTVYTAPDDEDVERFDAFIREYLDGIGRVIGRPDYDGRWLEDRYWPSWDDPTDVERFMWFAEEYGRVAVADEAVADDKVRRRVKGGLSRYGAEIMLVSSKVEIIESLPWESVVVGSWTSPRRFGETQLWDGKSLRRFPKQQKKTVRSRYATEIANMGVSPDAVQADDLDAVLLLAIRSWQALGDHLSARVGGYSIDDGPTDDDEIEVRATTRSRQRRGAESDRAPTAVARTSETSRHETDQELLPGFALEEVEVEDRHLGSDQGDGTPVTFTTQPTLQGNGSSYRKCDSCSLSAWCQKFEPGAPCAYKMPVQLRTKDQLNTFMRTCIEIQGERVAFARFAEQIGGDVVSADLSKEMDRLFGMIGKMAELNEKGDVVKMTIEARGNGGGLISQMFGAKAGEKARELPGGELSEQQTSGFLQAFATELP